MEKAGNDSADGARQPLIDLSIECWSFAKKFSKVLEKLDAGEAPRHMGKLRHFLKKLDESLEQAGLKLVNLEGQIYDSGMAISPLNIAEFDSNDHLIVEQMLEPIIMGPDGLIKEGKVMLGKVNIK